MRCPRSPASPSTRCSFAVEAAPTPRESDQGQEQTAERRVAGGAASGVRIGAQGAPVPAVAKGSGASVGANIADRPEGVGRGDAIAAVGVLGVDTGAAVVAPARFVVVFVGVALADDADNPVAVVEDRGAGVAFEDIGEEGEAVVVDALNGFAVVVDLQGNARGVSENAHPFPGPKFTAVPGAERGGAVGSDDGSPQTDDDVIPGVADDLDPVAAVDLVVCQARIPAFGFVVPAEDHSVVVAELLGRNAVRRRHEEFVGEQHSGTGRQDRLLPKAGFFAEGLANLGFDEGRQGQGPWAARIPDEAAIDDGADGSPGDLGEVVVHGGEDVLAVVVVVDEGLGGRHHLGGAAEAAQRQGKEKRPRKRRAVPKRQATHRAPWCHGLVAEAAQKPPDASASIPRHRKKWNQD